MQFLVDLFIYNGLSVGSLDSWVTKNIATITAKYTSDFSQCIITQMM